MMKNLPPKPEREDTKYPKLSSDEICSIIEKECGAVTHMEHAGNVSDWHYLFFLPQATQEFKHIVTYGRRSPMNHLEQKFIGYGHFFEGEHGSINIVVSHVIEIPTMNRSKISASNLGPNGEMNAGLHFLDYYRTEYQEYELAYNTDTNGKPIDPFLEDYGPSEYVLEAHTHPDLGAFISSTDHASGSARAATRPVCIFVCDPIRQEMIARIGTDWSSAAVVTCEYAQSDRNYLRRRGYSGHIRSRTCRNGKVKMKIKIVIPKKRKGKHDERRS